MRIFLYLEGRQASGPSQTVVTFVQHFKVLTAESNKITVTPYFVAGGYQHPRGMCSYQLQSKTVLNMEAEESHVSQTIILHETHSAPPPPKGKIHDAHGEMYSELKVVRHFLFHLCLLVACCINIKATQYISEHMVLIIPAFKTVFIMQLQNTTFRSLNEY
jgi:hypothetical protein